MSISWTTPDREAQTMTYEQARDHILRNQEKRVRLTYPNGARTSGVAGSRKIGSEIIATIDGATKMGELAGAILLETMRNGRYVA